jgi:OHCU decarboxylase
MTARIAKFNAQAAPAAEAELFACCGSRRWAREMTAHRPYRDLAHLCEAADKLWVSLDQSDWLEAFRAHPKIGERASQGAETARRWAAQEQSAARAVSQDVAARLAAQNLAYEKKFGYIFLVDATGKSSDEMLAILDSRIQNVPEREIQEAAEQQRRITRRRLEKLLSETR